MSGSKPSLLDDIERIRGDFPLLARKVRGKPPIYFDNACTTLRPEAVVRAMAEHMRGGTACHGRAYHLFGIEATDALAEARDAARRFVGAERPQEIVFVRNATEALNLVAQSLPWRAGDVVLTTDMEHNSNLLPWQRLSQTKGVRHAIVPVDFEAGIDRAQLSARLRAGVRLVSMFHVSNLTGLELPIREIAEEAHQHGALVLVDGAQSVLSRSIDVAELGADLFVFSLHKMMGPTGIGVLYGRQDVLEQLQPFLVGGDTVEEVSYADCEWSPLPSRLEAGVANVDAAVGAKAAIDYVLGLGQERIHEHVVALNQRATEGLSRFERVHIVGPADARRRSGVCNFYIEGIESRGLARVLDERANVMVRHGKHCVHAWYGASGVPESVRATFAAYNTPAEVDKLVRTIGNVVSLLG